MDNQAKFNSETLAAIQEADKIAKYKTVKKYTSVDELFDDISKESNPEHNNHK